MSATAATAAVAAASAATLSAAARAATPSAAARAAGPWPRPQQRTRPSALAAAASVPAATPPALSPDRLGVVIVDHGSKRAASNDALVAFCDVYASLALAGGSGGGHGDGGSSTSSSPSSSTSVVVAAVEPAHMELAEPTIEQAVGKCVARGCGRVVVAPFFLSRGRHIQDDIPALVAEARLAFPGVEVTQAAPLGADMEGLARILARNVERAAAVGGEGAVAAAAAETTAAAAGARG